MNIVELQLEIDGKYVTVDIDKSVTFPFNFEYTELENPTTVSNSYTKTISLPFTETNNLIFGNLWRIDSTYTNFDASIRVNFRLYINNSLFESGYVQLKSINNSSYNIVLRGELGNIFGLLNDVKLNELDFGSGNNNLFYHQNNSEQLFRYWLSPQVGGGGLQGTYYDYATKSNITEEIFNYALTYQGKYDEFDSKYEDVNGTQEEVIWDNGYKKYNTSVDVTEHMRTGSNIGDLFMGEYRSYYQKPMIKLKTLFNKCLSLAANKYNIELDDFFFNESNPYWQDTWVILPNYEPASSEQQLDINIDLTNSYFDSMYEIRGTEVKSVEGQGLYTADLGSITSGTKQLVASIPIRVIAKNPSTSSVDYARVKTNYLAIAFRIDIGDKTYYLKPPQGSSNSLVLRGDGLASVNNVDSIRPTKFNFTDYYYQKIGDEDNDTSNPNIYGEWIFNINTKIEIPKNTDDVKLRVEFNGNTYWQDGRNASSRETGATIDILDGAIIKISNTGDSLVDGVRSNSYITYNDIIRDNETSAFKFIVDYCKAFGLIFKAENNTISIQSKNTFYKDLEIVDWTYKMDRSKEILIEPIKFDHRYGIFKWGNLNTKYEDIYLNKVGAEYGSLKYNNNFAFDDSEKNYLEGNIFNNCIIARDKHPYYLGRSSTIYLDNKVLPHFEDNDNNKVDINYSLVFKDGTRTILANNSNRLIYPSILTDDTNSMYVYGYSWTRNYRNLLTSYPKLTRIMEKDGSLFSLNFGRPYFAYNDEEANYLSNNSTDGSETIYSKLWKSYLTDRNDSDSKSLTAYFNITNEDIHSYLLNKFFIIDDRLFTIVKIYDYNPLDDNPTKVELISVKDIRNYIGQTLSDGQLTLTYNGDVIYDNVTGPDDNPVTLYVQNRTGTIGVLSSLQNWTSNDLTPSSGDAGIQYNTTYSFTGNEGQVVINWGTNTTVVNLILIRDININASSVRNTGTSIGTVTVNNVTGNPVSTTSPMGTQLTFNTAYAGSDYFFGYWIINGQYYDSQLTEPIELTTDTTAVAYWFPTSQFVKYYAYEGTLDNTAGNTDNYTTISGVQKISNFWILTIGQQYTFSNSQGNWSGYLFNTDTQYTTSQVKTITANDNQILVFYDKVLINVEVTNYSPTSVGAGAFTGTNIILSGESFNFSVTPNATGTATQKFMNAFGSTGSLTYKKYPYHYPIVSQESFTTTGVYDITIKGFRVGWDGDKTVSLASALAQNRTETAYSPIPYTITYSAGINSVTPSSGNGNQSLPQTGQSTVIALPATSGTKIVTQTVGQFEYILTLIQPDLKPIGWKTGTPNTSAGNPTTGEFGVVNVFENKGTVDGSVTYTFYHNGNARTLTPPSGMTLVAGISGVDTDGSQWTNYTATWTENTGISERSSAFIVTCLGSNFSIIVTQEAGSGNWWGQTMNNGIVQGNISNTGNITPLVSCTYDIGSAANTYRNGYFCGQLNSATLMTSGNAVIGGQLSVTGTSSFTGAITTRGINNTTGNITSAGGFVGNLSGTATQVSNNLIIRRNGVNVATYNGSAETIANITVPSGGFIYAYGEVQVVNGVVSINEIFNFYGLGTIMASVNSSDSGLINLYSSYYYWPSYSIQLTKITTSNTHSRSIPVIYSVIGYTLTVGGLRQDTNSTIYGDCKMTYAIIGTF